jgi:hypothetical protein
MLREISVETLSRLEVFLAIVTLRQDLISNFPAAISNSDRPGRMKYRGVKFFVIQTFEESSGGI